MTTPTPKLPLRIAILETDTPVPGVLARYGTYGDIFKDLLRRGADKLKHPGLSSTQGLEISAYDVVEKQEYPDDLEKIDAILITGSKYDSFADTPWTLKLVSFTQKILNQSRIRIIGVCYGHQILARALNAPVGRSNSWELSVVPVTLTPTGQRLFHPETIQRQSIPSSTLNTQPNTENQDESKEPRTEKTASAQLLIHQMHQDTAYTYPTGVEPLGHTDACATQGMYSPRRLLSVQGHPEFNGTIMDELLDLRFGRGLFSREVYEEAKARAGGEHDGVVISAAFLRFLLE